MDNCYSIENNERRITGYVTEQAYLWLYERIKENGYIAGDTDSQRLLLDIRTAGKVTKDSYGAFLRAFSNDPYSYLLTRGRRKKHPGIVTSDVRCLFLKYNGVYLPLGFTESFFEDDYETRQEIRRFYKEYLERTKEQFTDKVRRKANDDRARLDGIEDSAHGIFRTRLSFHLANAVKLALLAAGIYMCAVFFCDVRIISCLGQLAAEGECPAIEANIIPIAANAAFAVILAFALAKGIRAAAFYVRLILIRLRCFAYKRTFTAAGGDIFDAYLDGVVGDLEHTGYRMTEGTAKPSPVLRRIYMSVMDFDGEKTEDDAEKILNRYGDLGLRYGKKTDMKRQRKKWGKGIVPMAILVVLIAFTDIPALNGWITEVYRSITDKGFAYAMNELLHG